MNQALLGASVPFAVAAVVYCASGFRASLRMLIAAPLCMAACALWAVVPDLPRLLGMERLYQRLARDPRTDIFFWHYTIDAAETDSVLYLAGAVALALAMLAAAWREVRRREAE
ncbi:MAG: hypothetical protein FJ225_02620 [Lentisphaerae bacterium]|nr:hypothetical protein [Lentisphaerota bacterium]